MKENLIRKGGWLTQLLKINKIMCGIAGIIVKNNNRDEISKFRTASKLLDHRGPDYFGEYIEGRIALFHYRLSILDLNERSNQPFISDDSVLCYNGEIYNCKQLAKQYSFNLSTTSDTEVLARFLNRNNNTKVEELNGIFAFAEYNKKENTLTLVRDRLGIKPLYYYEDENIFAFTSESKVIMAYLDSLKLNYQALNEFLWYSDTIEDDTFIRGIKKISPGTLLKFDLESCRSEVKTYWSINQNVREKSYGADEAIVNIRDTFDKAVKRQCVSDVPLGVFLSGGIDSSAIAAFASKHVEDKLNTFSVEYDFISGSKSELPKAGLIAKKFNTNHHELKLEAKHLLEEIEKLVFQFDDPFADPAILPLHLLSKACSDSITVVLQGDGGDELFGGYRRYRMLEQLNKWKLMTLLGKFDWDKNRRFRLNRLYNALRAEPGKRMALLLTPEVIGDEPDKFLTEQFREKLKETDPFLKYKKCNDKFSSKDIVQRMFYTDAETILRTYFNKVDKVTMLNSIESRVPFLDNELSDLAFSIPSKLKVGIEGKKYLFRKAVEGIVPDEILNAPKRGFETPLGKWFKGPLYEYARGKFNDSGKKYDFINTELLLQVLEKHKKGHRADTMLLWKALVLIVWLDFHHTKIEL